LLVEATSSGPGRKKETNEKMSSILGPVAFESGSSISVAPDGQLQKEAQSGSALADTSIEYGADAAMSGISFDFAKSGYPTMSIGLVGKTLVPSPTLLNFSVKFEGDFSGVRRAVFEESNSFVMELDRDEIKTLMLRVNGDCSRVEYLVNDVVRYTSITPPDFPLHCRVHYDSRSGNVWLPAQNVIWCRAVFKVIVLQVVEVHEKTVAIVCTNMAGDEVAKGEFEIDQSIMHFKEQLAQQIDVHPQQLRLINGGGEAVTDLKLLM
jgi:hypothetical protein